jgi:hypothetical protein
MALQVAGWQAWVRLVAGSRGWIGGCWGGWRFYGAGRPTLGEVRTAAMHRLASPGCSSLSLRCHAAGWAGAGCGRTAAAMQPGWGWLPLPRGRRGWILVRSRWRAQRWLDEPVPVLGLALPLPLLGGCSPEHRRQGRFASAGADGLRPALTPMLRRQAGLGEGAAGGDWIVLSGWAPCSGWVALAFAGAFVCRGGRQVADAVVERSILGLLSWHCCLGWVGLVLVDLCLLGLGIWGRASACRGRGPTTPCGQLRDCRRREIPFAAVWRLPLKRSTLSRTVGAVMDRAPATTQFGPKTGTAILP